MDGYGPEDNNVIRPILVIGEAPGEQEDFRGVPFVGPSGVMLRGALANAKVPLHHIRYTNAVRCRPPNNKLSGMKAVNACREFLHNEIARVRPRALLMVGGTALQSVMQTTGILSNRLRRFEYKLADGTTIPASACLHPAYVLRSRDQEYRFVQDIKYFARTILGDSGSDSIDLGSVKINMYPSQKELNEFLVYSRAHPDIPIAFDVETDTLEPYLDTEYLLMTCAVSNGIDTIVIQLDPTENPDRHRRKLDGIGVQFLQDLFADSALKTVAHNAKYDMHILRTRLGIDVTNLYADTMVLHGMLFPIEGGHDLDTVGPEILGIERYKNMLDPYLKRKNDPKSYHMVPYDVLARYNGLDAYVTQRVCKALETRLRLEDRVFKRRRLRGPSPQTAFHEILMPTLRTLFKMECRGIGVDIPYLTELGSQLDKDIADLVSKLHNLRIVKKFEDSRRDAARSQKELDEASLNPESSKQVSSILFDKGYYAEPVASNELTLAGNPSTNVDVLTRLQSEAIHPECREFCSILLALRGMTKLNGTYAKGLAKSVSPLDNRIHCQFHIGRVRTGRLSSSDPNLNCRAA